MEDNVNFSENRPQRFQICDAYAVLFQMPAQHSQVSQVALSACKQVVDHTNAVAISKQAFCQVRSDKPCAAGNSVNVGHLLPYCPQGECQYSSAFINQSLLNA
jgi:hypothetical protein